MSDRPNTKTTKPEDPSSTPPADLWRTPDAAGAGWRLPGTAPAETLPGWRVPALPQNLDAEPVASGAWHLPKPEDTTYSPDDEIEMTAPADGDGSLSADAEAALLLEDEADAAEVAALDAEADAADAAALDAEADTADAAAEALADAPLPFDDVESAPAPVEDDAPFVPPADVLPFDGADSAAPPPADATQAAADLPALDDDDGDRLSMSELIALASLVEDGAPAAPAQPAAAPEPAVDPADPGAYAREQLARLAAAAQADLEAQDAAPAAPAPAPDPAAPVDAALDPAADPAAYARRQLELLGATGAAPAVEPALTTGATPPPLPALDPVTAELADKYRSTEDRVRALRAQFQSGQMTRDQFQNELRQLMVLDEGNNWWMLGVESDTWYKYENSQWMPSVPPALQRAQQVEAARAAALSGVTGAGYLDTGALQPPGGQGFTSGATVQTNAINVGDYDDMPLPRAGIPVRDPDYTLPGTAGVYIPPTDPNLTQPMGATVPGAAYTDATMPGAAYTGATVANPAISDPGLYDPNPSIPAADVPDEAEPPSYDLDQSAPSFEAARKRQQESTVRTVLIGAAIFLAVIFLIGALGIGGGLAYYNSLAEPWRDEVTALANYQPQFQTARILDAEGGVIAELTSQEGGARENVSLDEVSPEFIFAVLATENERFYEDPGWDAIAIARAMIQNYTAGEIQSGASTITQQIARNLILRDSTVSAERKLQEIVIASEIAQRYDKNFILELYINEVFFGNQSYGVEAASQFYFNHGADALNAAQAALLAGLIQAPATYDPLVNPQAAFERMDTVLRLMRRTGCIQFYYAPYEENPFCIDDNIVRVDDNGRFVGGQALIQRAVIQTTPFEPRDYSVRYPHFVNFVQAQVEQQFGTAEMFRRGFTIRTTLIPRIQDTAQLNLQRYVQAAAGTGIQTGAAMVTNPGTGAIVAMVGSPDFGNEELDGQVNNVLTWQQPGSAIKPVVYTAALEGIQRDTGYQYYTPGTIIWDVPTTYNTTPPYSPTNYDRQFRGPVALRYALGNSYNVPAVKAFDFIGVEKFRDTAARMGLSFLDTAQFGLPTALGGTEVRLYDMMQAYGTLANNGSRLPLYAITGITDADGSSVPLPERAPATQAVQPQIAYLMANILADNEARTAAFGTNSGLFLPNYPGLVGAKTGTTNNSADLWTMGFSTNMVVGVWTGRVSNDVQGTSATTATAAIPIWNAVMTEALRGTQPRPFADPGGIVTAQICAETGTAFDPNQTCPTPRNELFLQSQPPPPATQAFVQTAAIDTWTGLRANQFCGESVETRTFLNVTDPTAAAWLATPAGIQWAAALNLPDDVQPLPPGECTQNTPLTNIRINTPTDGQQVMGALQVVGSATAQNFNRYQIEVAPVTDPNNFVIVDGPRTAQVQPGGVLGQWDTTTVPNGLYRVRLAAFASDGGYVYRVVQVGVNNPLPTPTLPAPIIPTAIIPPTIDPNTGGAPIPFDNGTGGVLPFDVQIATPTPSVPGI